MEKRKAEKKQSDRETAQRSLGHAVFEFAFVGTVLGAIITLPTLDGWWSRETALITGLTLCTVLTFFAHWFENAATKPDEDE